MAAKRKRAARKRVTPPAGMVPHAGGGSKPHNATPELRARVRVLAMIGYTIVDCATDLRIAETTFRKYYLDDFDQGSGAGKAKIAETGYQKAVGREAKYSESGKVLLRELEPDSYILLPMLRARTGLRDQKIEVEVVRLDKVFEDLFDLSKLDAPQLATFRELLEIARKDKPAPKPAD